MKRLILVCLCLIFSSSCPAADALRCIVLDVGEGQALLFAKGEKGVLVDTGNFANAFTTIKAINKHGVKSIDHIFLSHLHPDHSSAIFALMEVYPAATIFESGHRLDSTFNLDSSRWVAEALDSGRWQVSRILAGESVRWNDIEFRVLWPIEPEGEELNSQSLVIDVRYGDTSILIMGDATKDAESFLLKRGLLSSKVRLLVVGHHGAEDSTADPFLARIQPKYSSISTNRDNIKGYPSEAVLLRLKESGSEIHLTYESGDRTYTFSQ